MKKRIISILAIAALLAASIAVPCIAATEDTIPASVTVSERISITVSEDDSNPGINFGALGPGTIQSLEEDSASDNSTLTIIVEPDTNVNVDLQISGADFDSSFEIENLWYSIDYNTGPTDNVTEVSTIFASNVPRDSTVDIWHWLSVPDSVLAGNYSSNITYKAVPYVTP